MIGEKTGHHAAALRRAFSEPPTARIAATNACTIKGKDEAGREKKENRPPGKPVLLKAPGHGVDGGFRLEVTSTSIGNLAL